MEPIIQFGVLVWDMKILPAMSQTMDGMFWMYLTMKLVLCLWNSLWIPKKLECIKDLVMMLSILKRII